MRLEFPNGEHAGIRFSGGELRIGSAADNELVLSAPGVEPHHAVLTVDARGTILWLLSDEAGAYVNARPVRERAFLRLGDRVTIGHAAFVLKPEEPRPQAPSGWEPDAVGLEAQRSGPARVALRAVSGRHSGRVVPVRGRLVAGSDPSCELQLEDRRAPGRLLTIESDGRCARLRVLADDYPVEVNGFPVREAFLINGDQLLCGRQRFVVEAPGLLARPVEEGRESPGTTQVLPVPAASPAAAAEGTGGVWMLLAVAVLLAIAIALLFLAP
ncbi:MAG: FHA domain-containing protein [Xanthomonadales bacterium]|nr:FHA domain-containing protein [Xanthomonadales bacterium]